MIKNNSAPETPGRVFEGTRVTRLIERAELTLDPVELQFKYVRRRLGVSDTRASIVARLLFGEASA